jgi:hypothetical protein
MWILIVWVLTANGIIPDGTLLATNQEDCFDMKGLIDNLVIQLPSEVVGATCVTTEAPTVPRRS